MILTHDDDSNTNLGVPVNLLQTSASLCLQKRCIAVILHLLCALLSSLPNDLVSQASLWEMHLIPATLLASITHFLQTMHGSFHDSVRSEEPVAYT